MNKSEEAILGYYNGLLMMRATATTCGEINELMSAVQHFLNDQGYSFGYRHEIDRLKQDYDRLWQIGQQLVNASMTTTQHYPHYTPLMRPYKAPV